MLLLTATIFPPNNVPDLVVLDPELRTFQYIQALKFYSARLGKVYQRIVFAENSGASLEPISRVFGRNRLIELLSVEPISYPSNYGKGYGEMKLVDDAMQSSEILSQLPPSAVIWKLTGRYRVLNICQVIRARPQFAELYLDKRGAWMDMRVIAFTPRLHEQYLRGCCSSLIDV